jgi:hypothetical protein
MSLCCRRQLVSALSRVLPFSRFSRTIALFSLLGVTSSLSLGHAHLDEDAANAADSASAASIQSQRQDLESLTQALLVSSTPSSSQRSFSLDGFAQQSQSMSDPVTIAAARQQLLSSLIETHPEEVLRAAIPPSVRATLPTAVQQYVEEEVEHEGKLVVMYEDREDGNNRLHYSLKDGEEQLSLHFAVKQPKRLLTGSQVRVKGVQINKALVLASGSTSVQALTTVLPNTIGEQKTLVLLVNFQNNPTQPYDVNYARSMVFGTANAFDRENSQQQTWLTGDVFGWFTLPVDGEACDGIKIRTYAQQAAVKLGVNLSAYDHYIYAFPKSPCPWWGFGTVGGHPSEVWINGSLQLRVITHEMGHNFGLYHSNALDCGATAIGTTCKSIEYGDPLDTMGLPSTGHFNTFQKERLGWLANIATVQTSGTYVLDSLEGPANVNPQALKILKSTDPVTGKRNWYYVEYRQPKGFDSFLSTNSNVRNGVLIHTGSESTGNSSNLLDMTPQTDTWTDSALSVGQSFSDLNAGVTITPLWTNGSGTAVSVTFDSGPAPQPCAPADPVVKISPPASQWVRAGTTVNYTVSITNKDSVTCSASSFALQVTVPNGWAMSASASTVTIGPSNSGSATLQVTSPASAHDGFYTVTTKAVRSTAPASEDLVSATYVVASDLNVAVTTDQPSYPRREWVTLTAGVSFAGSPVKGAKVTFTITKPDGKVLKKTVPTGQDGSTSFKFRLQNQDPTGNYNVTAAASLKNVNPGEAATSFVVY